jgi:hypothetical protein
VLPTRAACRALLHEGGRSAPLHTTVKSERTRTHGRHRCARKRLVCVRVNVCARALVCAAATFCSSCTMPCECEIDSRATLPSSHLQVIPLGEDTSEDFEMALEVDVLRKFSRHINVARFFGAYCDTENESGGWPRLRACTLARLCVVSCILACFGAAVGLCVCVCVCVCVCICAHTCFATRALPPVRCAYPPLPSRVIFDRSAQSRTNSCYLCVSTESSQPYRIAPHDTTPHHAAPPRHALALPTHAGRIKLYLWLVMEFCAYGSAARLVSKVRKPRPNPDDPSSMLNRAGFLSESVLAHILASTLSGLEYVFFFSPSSSSACYTARTTRALTSSVATSRQPPPR